MEWGGAGRGRERERYKRKTRSLNNNGLRDVGEERGVGKRALSFFPLCLSSLVVCGDGGGLGS